MSSTLMGKNGHFYPGRLLIMHHYQLRSNRNAFRFCKWDLPALDIHIHCLRGDTTAVTIITTLLSLAAHC